MKKSLLTLAILGSFAAAATAQSTVTLSGSIYGGIGMATGGPSGRTVGLAAPASFMLSGREDLGGGNGVIFKLESGFSADTGNQGSATQLFDKQSWMGLQGGWGTVRIGRIYTPSFATLALVSDPTGTYSEMASTSIMEYSGVRQPSGIIYNTPGFNPWTYGRNGFFGAVAYYAGENAGSTNAGAQLGLNAGYSGNGLNVELSNHRSNTFTATGVPASYTIGSETNNTLLGANYELGVAKLFFAYAVNKTTSPTVALQKDNTDALIGATIPMGTGKWTVVYVAKNDKTAANNDGTLRGVSYQYPISKRTKLTAAYAHTTNQNTLIYKPSATYAVGAGDTGYTLGFDHAF